MKRTFRNDIAQIELKPFKPMSKKSSKELISEVNGLGIFTEKEVEIIS